MIRNITLLVMLSFLQCLLIGESKEEYQIGAAAKQELASEIADLRLRVQKRFDEAKEKFKDGMGPMEGLFEESLTALKKAELSINNNRVNEALKFNNKALSDLVKIAIEIEKNTTKSKSKSKPKKEQEEEQEEEQEKEDERLADMLEKIEELEEQQKQLNEEMRAKSKEELQEEEKKALNEKMKEQQKRLQEMSEKMKKQQSKQRSQQQAQQQMEQASKQMQQGQQQMQQGKQGEATQQAQQAQKNIENAKNDIKRAMRDQARQKLKHLAEKLDKAVEKQDKINEETAGVKDPKSTKGKTQMAELKKKQDEVKEEMQQVMDQLGAGANEMDESFPEVAEAIRKAREYAASQGIERRLKRSSNALHYNRKESAEREQQKLAESMSMFGHKVRDAVGRLPQATLEELLQMRQQIEQVRRESASLGKTGKGGGKLSKKLQSMFADIGERLKNKELMHQLPEFLAAQEQAGDAAAAQSSAKAVQQAAFILDALISRADLEKRLALNRRTGAAPDKYRKSVREYLKSLSKGKNK